MSCGAGNVTDRCCEPRVKLRIAPASSAVVGGVLRTLHEHYGLDLGA
jgi:hypothetical protein